MKLSKKQKAQLEDFIYHVSVDGIGHAATQRSPYDKTLDELLCAPVRQCIAELEKLMEENDLEYP